MAQSIGWKTINHFIAAKPPGKDFIALYPTDGGNYVPMDYLDWWTDDIQKIEMCKAKHLEEHEKVEAELAIRAEKRRKKK